MHRAGIKRQHLQLGLPLLLILLMVFSCSRDDEALAVYDGGMVSKTEFLNHYENYLSKTGLNDNLPDRKKILRSAIHEELILLDWHTKNLDQDPHSQEILKRQEEQAILDQWWQEKSLSSEEPRPEDLARMLVNEKSRYHLQESDLPDLGAANRVREEWIASGDAKVLDLGFISLEQVHPRLVELITDMDEGEVSSPIRIGDGYRLIKLVEKKAPPFIQPQEFSATRPRLTLEWKANRSDSTIDAYTNKIASGLDIQFADDACMKLLKIVQTIPKDQIQRILSESQLAAEKICSSRGGDWTIAMIAPYINDSRDEHLASVLDIYDVQNLIAGILVRRALIEQAMQAGIHKNLATIQLIQARQDLWRINTWQTKFADTVDIDPDYLAEIEQAEPEIYQPLVYRNVEVLVFPDTKTALISLEKLNSGFSPDALVSRIDPPPVFPSDGKLGWVSVSDLGQAAGLVFAQALRTWTEPWSYGGKSYLFRSTNERSEPVNKEERRENLINQIRAAGAPVQLERALAAMENDYNVKIDLERVKEIPFIKPSGPINES
ncbi:MAG: peptidylprolyl isomerase [Candidatus Marinimicrobia bacterium]|nr:peptidylprolyl isomerase [Candidatus Neomarinimicrobiota bacterium]